MAADDACARDGSFEVAGVNGLDVAVAQPIGKFFKLEDAYLGEGGIRVPVNWYILKPLHLSVSDEIKPGALFHGKASYGRRGLKSKKNRFTAGGARHTETAPHQASLITWRLRAASLPFLRDAKMVYKQEPEGPGRTGEGKSMNGLGERGEVMWSRTERQSREALGFDGG
jgi:hypothetical protein